MHLATTNNNIKDFKREVLGLRSSININSKKINKFKKETFIHAHKARKIRIGHRNSQLSGTEFIHRSALHNILEPEGDVYSNFSLEMGKSTLFYDETNKRLNFEEYEVAHVEALRPLYKVKRLAIKINYKKYKDLVFGVENIEQVSSDLAYAFSQNIQFSLHTKRTDIESKTTVLTSFYY